MANNNIDDMTSTDEAKMDEGAPEMPGDAEGSGDYTPENCSPVPESMADSLQVGQEVMGTVIEKDGQKLIEFKPEEAAQGDAYTGQGDDKFMNAEEALNKYVKGKKSVPATQ